MDTLQELPALPLEAMQAEVVAWCVAKGWRDEPVLWDTAMALLHEEAAEAGAAWRRWGFEDATPSPLGHAVPQPPKPEGVGSELADLLIRLLDDCDLYEVPLSALTDSPGRFGISQDFMAAVNVLHGLIARASAAFEFGWDDGPGPVERAFAAIYVYTCQLAAQCGIDLAAEYARKHAYNKTRPYRHGKRC